MPARVAHFRTLSMLFEAYPQPDGSNPFDPAPTGSATPLSVQALLLRVLEHFPEKWTPVFRKEMRQRLNLEHFPCTAARLGGQAKREVL
jgi:hypothetical protein